MTSGQLNHEDYLPQSDSNQPLLDMFKNCCDEEQFLQLIDQTISTKLSFGMKKVCELMVKKINVLLEQKHQEFTTALQCKYVDQDEVRVLINEEFNMRLQQITESVETKRMSRINQIKNINSDRDCRTDEKAGVNKLHSRKFSMASVKSAKMMTTEDSQRSPFTNKSSLKSILKSDKHQKSAGSLSPNQEEKNGESSSARAQVRVHVYKGTTESKV